MLLSNNDDLSNYFTQVAKRAPNRNLQKHYIITDLSYEIDRLYMISSAINGISLQGVSSVRSVCRGTPLSRVASWLQLERHTALLDKDAGRSRPQSSPDVADSLQLFPSHLPLFLLT